jgi:hypothetical protein
MRHFTDFSIENFADQLQNHWVELNIEPWRYNFLAKKWKCPNNTENRAILSEAAWNEKLKLFLDCGTSVRVDRKAEICRTSYGQFGTSYLVWLAFLDIAGNEHIIDVWISEYGKNTKNAEKYIDSRSPRCQDVYDSILKTSSISPELAKLLPTIGSKTWTGSTENKVQKKLNSNIQQDIFEKTAKECGVSFIKLDKFDDRLYRGDPGCLADYDLIIENYKVRVDLKLLESNSKLAEQKPHDAALLISSEYRTADTDYYRVCGEVGVETTQTFNNLLVAFKDNLLAAGKCFLHIDKIDLETGAVDYAVFGNNKNI